MCESTKHYSKATHTHRSGSPVKGKSKWTEMLARQDIHSRSMSEEELSEFVRRLLGAHDPPPETHNDREEEDE